MLTTFNFTYYLKNSETGMFMLFLLEEYLISVHTPLKEKFTLVTSGSHKKGQNKYFGPRIILI